MPVPCPPPPRCAWRRSTAPRRCASTMKPARSCPARPPILPPCTSVTSKPNRCITQCRNWSTPAAATRSPMCGWRAAIFSNSERSQHSMKPNCSPRQPRGSNESANMINGDAMNPHSQLNVDPAEVAKFDQSAMRWWDTNSEYKPLHDINPLRLDYIDQRAGLAGKSYNPITMHYRLGTDVTVNYLAHTVKENGG